VSDYKKTVGQPSDRMKTTFALAGYALADMLNGSLPRR
jgi:hypothetical protein